MLHQPCCKLHEIISINSVGYYIRRRWTPPVSWRDDWYISILVAQPTYVQQKVQQCLLAVRAIRMAPATAANQWLLVTTSVFSGTIGEFYRMSPSFPHWMSPEIGGTDGCWASLLPSFGSLSPFFAGEANKPHAFQCGLPCFYSVCYFQCHLLTLNWYRILPFSLFLYRRITLRDTLSFFTDSLWYFFDEACNHKVSIDKNTKVTGWKYIGVGQK